MLTIITINPSCIPEQLKGLPKKKRKTVDTPVNEHVKNRKPPNRETPREMHEIKNKNNHKVSRCKAAQEMHLTSPYWWNFWPMRLQS